MNYSNEDFISLYEKVYETRLISDDLKKMMLLIIDGQFQFIYNLLSCKTKKEFDESEMTKLINDGDLQAIGYNLFVSLWQNHERPLMRNQKENRNI